MGWAGGYFNVEACCFGEGVGELACFVNGRFVAGDARACGDGEVADCWLYLHGLRDNCDVQAAASKRGGRQKDAHKNYAEGEVCNRAFHFSTPSP